MAKVFFSQNLPAEKECWREKNGSKKTELVVLNNLNKKILRNEAVDCSLSVLNANKKAVIIVNPIDKDDNRVFGVYMCKWYGYTMQQGEEIFVASSVGGYGNSKSKMGIYTVGTVLAVHSYKHRHGDSFYRLTASGWVEVDDSEIFENEITII